MNAGQALKAARDAGVQIGIAGDVLMLNADTAPPHEVLELLSLHKSQVIALLRPGEDGWSGVDWLAFFDRRAGIAKFDGNLTRGEVDARAFSCCVSEWLNRNPVRSPPVRCLGCGDDEQGNDPLLPFGTEPTGHAWLHWRCWPAWYSSRRAEAVTALSIFGIPFSRTTP